MTNRKENVDRRGLYWSLALAAVTLIAGGQLLSLSATTSVGAAEPSRAPTSHFAGHWAPMGPAPIVDTLNNTMPDGGSVGAIETVAAHPTDPDILFVGPVNGGIWRTDDATSLAPTWYSVGDSLGAYSVGALEFDPTSPSSMLGGYGVTSSFGAVSPLTGLLHSVDGGATWTEITDPLLDGASITAVAIRGAIMVAAAKGEHFYHGANTFGSGVFRSTDWGGSWTQIGVTEGLPSNSPDVFDMAGDPSSTTRLYAAVEDGGVGSIRRSDDTGATWTDISSGDADLSAALFDSGDGSSNGAELAVASNGRLYVSVISYGQPKYIGYTDNPTGGSPTWVRMDLPLAPQFPVPLPIADASNGNPIVITMPNGTITDATNTIPIVITSAGHGLSTGDVVRIDGVAGNEAANGYFWVTVLDGDTFELDDSEGSGAYLFGGQWGQYHWLWQFGVDQAQITGATGNTAANGLFAYNVLNAYSFELYDRFTGAPVDGTTSGVYSGGGTLQIVVGVNPKPPGGQGMLHHSLAVDPSDPDTIYIGGDTQAAPYGWPNALGAATWEGSSWRGDASVAATGSAPSPQWEHLTHSNSVAAIPGGGTASSTAHHADSRQITFDANGNLIQVDDGGVFRRTSPGDNTGDWFSINSNLQVTEFHDIAYDSNSDIIFGGTQDNGTVGEAFPGSAYWVQIQGGDGGDGAVEVLTTVGHSLRYTSSQYLGDFTQRTYDASNVEVTTIWLDPEVTDGSDFWTMFVTDIEMNVVDGTRLLIGNNTSVHESLDQGATMASVDSGGGLGNNDSFARRTLAYGGIRGGTPDAELIYIGFGSEIYVRETSGPAPAPTGTYPGGYVQSLVPNPIDWDTLVVTDRDSNDVWITEDAGATWSNITGDLPVGTNFSVYTVEFLPGTVDRVVVGTSDGVWAMERGTPGVWTSFSSGLPTTRVYELWYDRTDDVLVAGTLGRGAYLLADVTCDGGTNDPDGDLVCDPDDNCPTTDNPGQEDADGDLVGDACDNCPIVDNPGQVNSDGDSFGDACDNCPDDDNETQDNSDTDGHGDACDNCLFVDNPGQENADGDLLGDACDLCPIDPLKIDPGVCGCGIPDVDTDGDTVPDCIDPCPADNPDDTDGDGTCDSDDGCPDDGSKTEPGACGCGVDDSDEAFVRFIGEYGDGEGEVYFPRDLTVDDSGRIWVADTANHKLQVFDAAGNWLFDVGSQGSGSGEFDFPEGIAQRPFPGPDWIYVSDSGNHRVQVLDATADGAYVGEFGSFGSGLGEFDSPFGVAVHPLYLQIYVADRFNNRIQVFSTTGAPLATIGSFGTADGQFNFPLGVAYDSQEDQILVADSGNSRIQGFNALTRVWAWTFGGPGTLAGEFDFPVGIHQHPGNSQIWVADTFNHRVQRFTNDGTGLTFVAESGELGADSGELQAPGGMAYSAISGHMLGADINNSRIVNLSTATTLTSLQDGDLLQPEDVTVDASGRIYVSNTSRGRIEVFDASGAFVTSIGNLGTGPGELQGPVGVGVDASGNVYVAERDNNRVSVFDSAGVYQFDFPGGLNGPQGLALESGTPDRIHVADTGNHRVAVFDSTNGSFITEYGVGTLSGPSDVTEAGTGGWWVSDTDNDRAYFFDAAYAPQSSVGSTGSGPGQFNLPWGVAGRDGEDWVYGSDSENHNVQALDSGGVVQSAFGSNGDGPGLFDGARGIEITPSLTVYVVDAFNSRLHVWGPGDADDDGDGTANCADLCPGDPDKTEPGVCGCLSPDVDSDGDLTLDCNDECPLDALKTTPGVCGCGVADVDTDGDTVLDCLDPCPLDNPDDTDGDLTCDSDEQCPLDPLKIEPGVCGCGELDSGFEFQADFGQYGQEDGETVYGRDVAIDSLGRFVVTDSNNDELDVFDSSGQWLFSFGSTGTGDGEFDFPEGITVDSSGNIYVVESTNHRVQKFNSAFVHQFTFGAFGTASGEFDTPHDVAVAGDGSIWVTDGSNHRVQKFDASGNHLLSVGTGFAGTLLGEFDTPWGIGIRPDTQDVWVSEFGNDRVQILNSVGVPQSTFGGPGSLANEYNGATGITFLGSNEVAIGDAFNHRVQVYNYTTGAHLRMFGVQGNDPGDYHAVVGLSGVGSDLVVADVNNSRFQVVTTTGTFVNEFGGPEPGEMLFPMAVDVGSSGIVAITDTGLNQVNVFDGSTGQFLFDFGEPGTAPGHFDESWGVAVHPGTGRFYVTDTYNHRIQVFESDGSFLRTYGADGSATGQFSFPVDIEIVGSDVWVADFGNGRVQRFNDTTDAFVSETTGLGSPYGLGTSAGNLFVTDDTGDTVHVLTLTGAPVTTFGSTGAGPGQFDFPRDVAVHPVTGEIYVSDGNHDRISIYSGGFLHVSDFGVAGSGPGEFDGPAGLDFGSNAALWIAENENTRAQVWMDRGLDLDGDGDGNCIDCEVLDPLLFPSNPEVCDGVDNDCDTEIDEDAVDAETWYPDVDADLFGDDSGAVQSCTQPPDTISTGGDCNDGQALINPDADEVCDGVDNDCDDDVDGDAIDAGTWYPDMDADLFGDDGGAVQACVQPPETVASGGDCNDGDPTAWAVPSATTDLLFAADSVTLSWIAPGAPGGLPAAMLYDLILSFDTDFTGTGTCAIDDLGVTSTPTAGEPTGPGEIWYYLVRPQNGCGVGPLGDATAGPRPPSPYCP